MNKTKKLIVVLIVLIQILIIAGIMYWWNREKSLNENTSAVSVGTVYYVSPTGNDSNTGSISSPFKTLTYATNKLQPGDTLLLFGGTYNEKLRVTTVGTAAFPVTVGPVPGQQPIIDAAYAFTPAVAIAGSYVNISGLTVKNASSICELLSGSHIESKNMIITGCTSHGTQVTGTYITVDSHTIYNSTIENKAKTWSGGWGSALKIREADNVIVKNNKIYKNYGEGMGVRGTNVSITDNLMYDNYSVNLYIDNTNNVQAERNIIACTSDAGYYRSGAPASGISFGVESFPGWGMVFHDNIVRNNFITGCSKGISYYYGTEEPTGGFIKVSVLNNTVMNSTDSALSINYSPYTTGSIVANNIFQQQNGKLAKVPNPQGITFKNNYWVDYDPGATVKGVGDVIGINPLGTSPVYSDKNSFKIMGNSKAVNAAANLVTHDGFGVLRSLGGVPDIGAHEVVAQATLSVTPTASVTVQPTITISPTSTVAPTPTPTPTPTIPISLQNVYFTFGRYRYGKTTTASDLYRGDTLYVKNFDPKKLRILQLFLYDYVKKGNQGYTERIINSTTRFAKTNYLLPRNRQYAYVMKFQDIETGIIMTKYFVIYVGPQ